MKRKLGLLILIVLLGVMTACGKKDEVPTEVKAPEILEVELTVSETADVDEPVEMKAFVTQGDEEIEDADEVVFEVWEEGKKSDSEMIDSNNEKAGIYTAEKSFDHDGLFHVQVHVTANGLHTMPLKEVVVGDGGNYDEQAEPDHHYHTEGFSMEFTTPEEVAANSDEKLVVQIKLDNEPYENLRVRYEIWSDLSEKHEWVKDVKEIQAGEYVADHIFKEAGTYHVQIHVEDDKDLHEHVEHEIVVK
ncbi:FixH family protein [Sporosarcina sp. Marseille-Q4063]|uniref:FixH family protein n=1 Tax=Sporosarcina sp. Marseille-Q4063 TaxID=2810514 RepID=UPI001BAF7D6B|nr:FixH family protein [Sporosarcina sp. Marseille-Q4063]QUW22842.1 FixH family protein [Sporosarcina sp. Marseille-Q4063]